VDPATADTLPWKEIKRARKMIEATDIVLDVMEQIDLIIPPLTKDHLHVGRNSLSFEKLLLHYTGIL
jgi:hypothetical protein